MKVKLRASGHKVQIPSSPSALSGRAEGLVSSPMSGDATPVNSRRVVYAGAPQASVMSGPPSTNGGKYTPPPKNPIWVDIPVGIKPTPFRPVKACRGCG